MDVGSSSGGGGGEERPKKVNKKGMWTPQEDETLTEYVRRHGEGNWNAVQRHTPLLRSGKSCRLRWTNHLRPDLKKGAFSPEEESLVVQLHAEYGNRWAHMATLLPGRTDNEIKNFWNTRMKRIRRAYSPIYPLRFRRAQITESSPSNPSLAVGNAQPPPPFFGASSSQWNWPEPGQCQHHQLPPQSTIAGLRHHLSAFCAESHLQSKGASVVLPSIQITPLGTMVPSTGGFFPTPSKEGMSGLLGDLLGESETLAQKEMEKNKRESLGGDGAKAAASSSFAISGEPIEEPINKIECMDDGLLGGLLAKSETLALKEIEKHLSESLNNYHAEAAYQATSPSFGQYTQFSGGAPTEEPINEIECMDDGLLVNLLAEFETLVPKEMEKNHSENLSSHCAKATATSTSFTEYTQFSGGEPTKEPIDEIDCMDDGVLGNLLAESETLALKKMKKNHGDSWSAYYVEVADQATSSSFNEHTQFSGEEPTEEPINEIECMDDNLPGDLLAECETLALKEMEKNRSESSSGYCTKAVDQATSSSFNKHTQFFGAEPTEELITEIECLDNGLFGDLLVEPKTLALKKMEKNKSESLSSYLVEVADQATSTSFTEYIQFSGGEPTKVPIDEIDYMDDGVLGNLLAESKTLALKEMKKNHSDSWSAYYVEVANQATLSSFNEHTQFSGEEPTEEPINEIVCIDDNLLGDLLVECETLALKETEKNRSESSSGYCAKAVDQATFSSFGEHTQFFGAEPTEELIAEIECLDNGLLRVLLVEPETLALKEMEKNKGESLSGYLVEVEDQATSTSFTKYIQFSGGEPTKAPIDEIDYMDDGVLGNLLAESKTLALKEMKKNHSDSWSAYYVEVADQATSSSFNEHTQFSGEEPIEEPINEIVCMDNNLLGDLLAECETLALKEMEKNRSETSSGYCAMAMDQAISSSFSEHTQFFGVEPTEEPIVEIECLDNGLLGDLFVEPETLALKEMEKNNSESLIGYFVEVADQATSSSFSEYTLFSGGEPTEEPMDEIQCMNDDSSGLLSSFASTMPSLDW